MLGGANAALAGIAKGMKAPRTALANLGMAGINAAVSGGNLVSAADKNRRAAIAKNEGDKAEGRKRGGPAR